MAPLRNSTAPDERRHQTRHRLTSTVYVELGPGNGGIIVTLGSGGLSVHAAVKLKAEMELTLRFRLEPTEEPIEVAGRVAWLDPTQKEAGISFQDLSGDAERRIADWIAEQERPVSVTQHDISPQPKSPPMSSAGAPLSVRAPVPASLAAETPENPQPNVSERIPRRVIPEPSLDSFSSTPSELQWTASLPAALTFPTLEERFERPSDRLLRGAPKRRYEIIPQPAKPAPATQELVPKDSQLMSLMPSPAKVIEVSRVAPQAIEVSRPVSQANDSAALKLRLRRKLGMAGAAAAAGILALMVTVMSVSKPPARHDSNGEPVMPTSSVAAVAPASVPQTVPEAPTDQAGAIAPSEDLPPDAYYDLLPILPTHLPVTVDQGSDWSARLEAMLGMDVGTKLNPEILALRVWAVRHSGYYYCVESLNSNAPQPGALMMQGEALQTGYRPKLGNYCN